MLNSVFTPGKIGTIDLKNRLVVSPMVCNYCTEDGQATERYIAYHEEKAKGGWGLIITENYAITPDARGFTNMACMYEDSQIESHKELTKRVHAQGGKIVAQMVHAGRQTNRGVNTGVQPVAPTSIPCPANQEMPSELTAEEIKALVERFGDAARRFEAAGFDGIEVHGGHGYLIAEFMSLYSNKRVDEYGGVLYNRMRFVREIIDDIHAKTSPGFPILFRISAEEMMPGGRTIQDTTAIAMLLEEWGIDAIDITSGTYGEDSTVPSMAVSHSWNINSAEEVKLAVNIPVMIVGRINDPFLAESAVKTGKTDFVIMGRGSLADPDLPNKAKAGEYDLIRQCIGCLQGCIGRLGSGPIACLVNPQLGFEFEKVTEAEVKKKVCVVGGGPAGIEAARAAAMRGHAVVLVERRDRLGGAFTIASYTPYKGELATYVAWAKAELKRLGVDIWFCTAFQPEMAKEFDVVVVATGGKPYIPESIEMTGSQTIDAQRLIVGELEKPGDRCAVLGGGLIGLEAAVHLGWLGREVTIIEMLDEIASDVEGGVLPSLLDLVVRYGINVITGAKVKKIDGGKVVYEKDGKEQSAEFDTVVTAMGVQPDTTIKEKIEGSVPEVYIVGDALSARKALEATREGFEAGLKL